MRRLASASPRLVILGVGDALLVAGAAWLGSRLGMAGSAQLGWLDWHWFVLLVAVHLGSLSYGGLYRSYRNAGRLELYSRAASSFGLAAVLLLGARLLVAPTKVGSDGILLAGLLGFVGLLAWREAFAWAVRRIGPGERWLIVGTGPEAVALARELHDRRTQIGIEIVGFIDPDPRRVGDSVFNPRVVGVPDDIPSIVRRLGIDRVVVNLTDARGQLNMSRLLEMRLRGVRFDHMATVAEAFTGRIALENLRPSWLIFSSGFNVSPSTIGLKRCMDVVLAALGLCVMSPLLMALATLVKATSRGPVLYRQVRVGVEGHLFELYKFRSMRDDAEAETGPVWAQVNDTRTTAVGRVMRRYRLDELPQLWNVLLGDMSLVGPRPERPEFVSSLATSIPFYGLRHSVRPGLTGWAQIRYGYGASSDDALRKLQYDLFYIKNFSLWMDAAVLAATLKTIVSRPGT